MDCSRLRGISNLTSTARAEESTLILWRESFRPMVYTPTPRTFSALGLRPEAFPSGVRAYVLDESSFVRFCLASQNGPPPLTAPIQPGRRLIEIAPREAHPSHALGTDLGKAFYPLSVCGELDRVRRGALEFLSPSSRVIVLHRHFTNLELKHELIHDYFLGPKYSASMRRDIMFEVVHLVKRAFATNDSKLLQFFEEANQRCKIPCRIEDLKDLECRLLSKGTEIGPNLFIYANECFTYAWELLLGHKDAKLGVVPQGLKDFLKKYPIG